MKTLGPMSGTVTPWSVTYTRRDAARGVPQTRRVTSLFAALHEQCQSKGGCTGPRCKHFTGKTAQNRRRGAIVRCPDCVPGEHGTPGTGHAGPHNKWKAKRA